VSARSIQNVLPRQAFGRFIVVGGASYVIAVLVDEVLLLTGLQYLAAAALDYIVATVNSFAWNRVWTFRAVDHPVFSQGARFILVTVIVFGVYLALVRFAVFGDIPEEFAQPAAGVAVAPLSFSLNRSWAFADRHGRA
jgi:putative flippase GtrA